MSDSEQCSNRLQLDLMLMLDNFLCELNSHILYILWPFRLNITFGWLQKLNPGYEICIISYQVNLSSEVSAMFNRLNIRSLPFVVFLGVFPSRCQNLSSGAIRPGGLLFHKWSAPSDSSDKSSLETTSNIKWTPFPSGGKFWDRLLVILLNVSTDFNFDIISLLLNA